MDPKVIAVLVLMMMCCSSSVGAFFLIPSEATTGPTGPTGRTGPAPQTFGASTLPSTTDATIVETGYVWDIGEPLDAPDGSYSMVLQGDNNLCINEPGKARGCLMSHNVGGTAKAYFEGNGNICVRNQANMGGDAKCYMSHNNDVPDGQHRLVLHKDGSVYVDHGTGVAGRFVIPTD